MTILFLALWLQMSAPCQSAKLYYDGVLVDEEPHCGLLNQVINMPTALDDITRQELAEAAQRAADETDGKPPQKWGDSGNGGGKPGYACIPGDERKECAITFAESAVDVQAVQLHDQISQPVDISDEKPFAEGCHAAGFHYNWSLHGCMHPRYTCKEKSRVLLTSEDGKKHCIKF